LAVGRSRQAERSEDLAVSLAIKPRITATKASACSTAHFAFSALTGSPLQSATRR
jgi:hypothetical protein